jgi:hypothetical protein
MDVTFRPGKPMYVAPGRDVSFGAGCVVVDLDAAGTKPRDLGGVVTRKATERTHLVASTSGGGYIVHLQGHIPGAGWGTVVMTGNRIVSSTFPVPLDGRGYSYVSSQAGKLRRDIGYTAPRKKKL